MGDGAADRRPAQFADPVAAETRARGVLRGMTPERAAQVEDAVAIVMGILGDRNAR
jgi:hypothetical protein